MNSKNHHNRTLIVGAGFAGVVTARELAEKLDHQVEVIDSRDHIGGNCYSRRDSDTGIMEHVYGPHIFNTNHVDVVNYVRGFAHWEPFVNRVKARNSKGVFSMPINLHTINQFFDKQFSPREAAEFIRQRAKQYEREPANFEEQALSMIGEDLYHAFIYGYTKKQWGCEPRSLPADIIKRLPVRYDYNDNFYNSKYQMLPREGYGDLFNNILNHSNIRVTLNQDFHPDMVDCYDHVIYTGCIDGFFNYKYGRLGYRTVEFQKYIGEGDFQGNAVINYTEENPKTTRVHEHKHFSPWEHHDKTLVLSETSKETTATDTPFYPKRLRDDIIALEKYRQLAIEHPKLSFLGRLGTYRYLDMDQVIGESLDFVQNWAETEKRSQFPTMRPKVFPAPGR